jgi:hypothetical protein
MTPVQLNIKELLTQLYFNRHIIDYIFGNKQSVSKSELLSKDDITEDTIKRLAQFGIVEETEQTVSLNDSISNFLEDFLEIGEVTPGFINDSLDELKRNIKYYRDTREVRFLRGIKKYLRRINNSISREVFKLQKNVDETYKGESNYKIKMQRLEDYREKRDAIIDFIKRSETTIEESRNLFSLANDTELYTLTYNLKMSLIENIDYLVEIQTDITDYINKIRYQLEVYKKVQEIKEVKDRGELHYKTNFKEVVNTENSLLYSYARSPRTRVSIEYLFSDDGHTVCKKVAEKYKLGRMLIRGRAEGMSGDFKSKQFENFVKLDTEALVEKFLKQDLNLFEYLMLYKFPKSLGVFSFEERITLFVELAMEFDKLMDFTYQLKFKDFNDDNGKVRKIGFTTILPIKEVKEKKVKA